MMKSLEIEEQQELKKKKKKWLKIKCQYERMTDIMNYKNFKHSNLYKEGEKCFPAGLNNLDIPLPDFSEAPYLKMEQEKYMRGFKEIIRQQEMPYIVIKHLRDEAQERQEELKKQIEGYNKTLKEYEKRKKALFKKG